MLDINYKKINEGLIVGKIIYTKNAPAAIGPYSQAVLAGNTLYCSGQIALDETGLVAGSIEVQTEKIMKNISAILTEAGFDFENVVKTTCFLLEMSDFASFNKIYEKHFTSHPARSCVAVKELPKGALIEVEVVAVK